MILILGQVPRPTTTKFAVVPQAPCSLRGFEAFLGGLEVELQGFKGRFVVELPSALSNHRLKSGCEGLWEMDSRQCVPYALSWGYAGICAAGNDRMVRFWDSEAPQCLALL